jgi:ABC-type branched-subunit amino acid transport system ATPase component
MLRSIHIKNFRGFRDLQIEPLERINLIAGRNNVGKTALLEAIFLHLGPTMPELGMRINQWRGILQSGADLVENWDSLFHNLDVDNPIEISSRDEKEQKRELTISLPEAGTGRLAELHASEVYPLGPQPIEGMMMVGRAKRELLFSFRNGAGQTSKTRVQSISDGSNLSWKIDHERSVETPLGIFIATRLRSPQEDAERFSQLAEIGQDEAVLATLKLLEPRLRKLTVLVKNGKPVLHGDIGVGRLLPLPHMGEGVARLLALWLAIKTTPHGIILVDEIENGLHYAVMKNVWKALIENARRSDAQILATTHNWECIRTAHEAFEETESYDFALYRLDRIGGDIHAVTYDQDMLRAALVTDLEVR